MESAILQVVRAIRVDTDRESVRAVLNDYRLLPSYERKLRRVESAGPRDHGVEVAIVGRFAALPFRGRLVFTARVDGGFDGVLVKGAPLVGFGGSFIVRRSGAGCVVTHVERYEFRAGFLGSALAFLLEPWLGRSIEGELRRMKRLAEEPEVLAAARRGERVEATPDVRVWDPSGRPVRVHA